MTIPEMEEMLQKWIQLIGRGTSESEVAELAKAIALERIAQALAK